MNAFNTLIHRISYPTILVIFFLPFLTVKCSTGQKIFELNGYQMTKGGNYSNKISNLVEYADRINQGSQQHKDFETQEKEIKTRAELRNLSSINPNPALITFLISTVFILILSYLRQFQRLKLLHLLLFTIVQLLCLIFYFAFIEYYNSSSKSNKLLNGYEMFVEVQAGYGFYFCFAIVFALMIFQLKLLSDYHEAKLIKPDVGNTDESHLSNHI